MAPKRQLRQEIQEAIDEGSCGSLCAVLSRDGSRPLHRAVGILHLGAVRLLLERADPNERTEPEGTPLQVCVDRFATASRGTEVGNFLAVPLEEELGNFLAGMGELLPAPLATLRPLHEQPPRRATSPVDGLALPLGSGEYSEPLDVARALLGAGAEPEPCVLLHAATCADPALGLLLLEYGAAASAVVDGQTPLWPAALYCALPPDAAAGQARGAELPRPRAATPRRWRGPPPQLPRVPAGGHRGAGGAGDARAGDALAPGAPAPPAQEAWRRGAREKKACSRCFGAGSTLLRGRNSYTPLLCGGKPAWREVRVFVWAYAREGVPAALALPHAVPAGQTAERCSHRCT